MKKTYIPFTSAVWETWKKSASTSNYQYLSHQLDKIFTWSHGLSLDMGSSWVTMLKKVQTQRESTAQNITINSLPVVEWLILSSGDQLQNKEYYKVAEIEVLVILDSFAKWKKHFLFPFLSCLHPHNTFSYYVCCPGSYLSIWF